ncbi:MULTISPECIES: gamma-glutamylcyclotransferase [unclassified Crossiella]|uniref:gamma-glutamylcyclotransferase family protein n=1 Tax=unclassified Crossiella TaxID=2620835 RepID=UPI001FFF1C9F|nr:MULTISPECIES: gamma-glutamylcyclotransferase family protein [unclassified Crossiella]MCK2238038.1 gamma-glutamylcyclotransferase [Crossiella sp. S99.2]MCK2255321.1 gamma-glutamylcyclotransferase [Crossiella sp. S99.1]
MAGAVYRDEDFPADPYPGAVPPSSYLHADGLAWPLRETSSGAVVEPDGVDLDEWLVQHGEVPLSGRIPVLTYGSNRNPSKITWLRQNLGLPGAVVVLRAHCADLAAVWASGFRLRDGARPATLAAAPGVTETHAVWLATPAQLRVLDVVEGRGERYRLARVHTGRVTLGTGAHLDGVLSYVARGVVREPLLVDGHPVRCQELSQDAARELTGVPGYCGLAVTEITGAPDPGLWPDRVFVYGTLQPGCSAWSLAAPWVSGTPRRASVPGTLYDTGEGWPGLLAGTDGEVPGWLLPLADPVAALPVLDEYEGAEYRRIRITLADGTVCWTYVFTAATDGFRVVPSWPAGHV